MYNFQFSIPGLMDMQTPASDSLPVALKLANHSASDSRWAGIASIGPVTEAGEPMDNAASYARIEFAPTSDGKYPLFCLATAPEAGEGSIIIEGAASNWLFTVPAQPLPLPPGLWYWTLSVTDDEDIRRLIYRGTLLVTV